ncbi:MAG: polysaccharide biosynthesis/export family protein [Verrucomicrobia bacterium]|nr:polysaccharide biosynthesis/export family protein [Verrucomicrobiota bacterium]
MKTAASIILLTLFFSTSSWSQDPKFRDAQQRPAASPAGGQAGDDSNLAASRISSMAALDDSIPLRVGYRVSLRIVEDKEKTLSLLVQDSGDIVAPHLGLVRAAGLTCKNIAFFMKRELEKQYFQQATVIVSIESIPRNPNNTNVSGTNMPEDIFTVFGQVARQGKYEMFPDEELSISQAILRAGGFAQFAQTKDVRIIRKVKTQSKPVEIHVNVDDIMTNGKLHMDIPVRPNDVIIVKEKKINL